MATLRIRHETVYRYRSPVAFGEHRMLLRPREAMDQHTIDYRLEIEPQPKAIVWSEDSAGNAVATASFGKVGRELRFVATMVVDQTPLDIAGPALPSAARTLPLAYEPAEMAELAPFIARQHPDPGGAVAQFAAEVLAETEGQETWPFLVALNRAVHLTIAYRRREEQGTQPAAETLRLLRGTCRDFAVLMIEMVRTQGLAARFVSGYLYVPHDESRAREAGGSTHAWLQVYLPGAGWIDFDPTSGWVGNAGLVRVATVRDPSHATPLSGSYLGTKGDYLDMSVDVDVTSEGQAIAPAWVSLRAVSR